MFTNTGTNVFSTSVSVPPGIQKEFYIVTDGSSSILNFSFPGNLYPPELLSVTAISYSLPASVVDCVTTNCQFNNTAVQFSGVYIGEVIGISSVLTIQKVSIYGMTFS